VAVNLLALLLLLVLLVVVVVAGCLLPGQGPCPQPALPQAQMLQLLTACLLYQP
jgi:hypothetical protein